MHGRGRVRATDHKRSRLVAPTPEETAIGVANGHRLGLGRVAARRRIRARRRARHRQAPFTRSSGAYVSSSQRRQPVTGNSLHELRPNSGACALTIRRWAKANHVELPKRGRISQRIIDQFEAQEDAAALALGDTWESPTRRGSGK